jgi:hypothetical protein
VLKDLADQRNTLMHEPAPEKPKVTDAAIALLSLLHHPSPDRLADEGVHRSEPAGRAGHP